MRYKKILFTFLSAAFFSVALADTFSWTQYQFVSATSATSSSFVVDGISLDEAQKRAAQFIGLMVDASTYSVSFSSARNYAAVSNRTTGVNYISNDNPYKKQNGTFFTQVFTWCKQYNYPVTNLWDGIILSGGKYYFQQFDSDLFVRTVYDRLSVTQLLQLSEISSKLTSIQTDVSDLLPALESHASNVSNLTQIVSSVGGVSTNLQSDVLRSINSIDYALNASSGISGIYNKLDGLDLSTASPYYLGQTFAAVYGMETYPEQALISSGLASSYQDAVDKLADPNWCHKTLVPAIENQRKKNSLVSQLESSGLSPPAGKSWRDLKVPELETIYEYSYNTPLADVTEVTTNWLPNIGGKVDDIAGSVSDIRDKVENGIFEVNVMNWPDDFFGFQVTLSNAFAEVFANLSITGRVIELDEDYKRYRDLYGLNGINAPSFDTVFSNAQFLAVGSPSDVNWWRESQNLLSYIAYYGTYNERIYNEISSTNFLAELAAITNRLSVLGDVEATVRRLTDDAIETGEDLKSTLENLTYYRGVSKWCDDYLQAGDTPDRVHLFSLDDHEFYIDIGQSYAFVDLIHGISAFAITLSWICVLPYIIMWLIDWFRKFADFWAQKIVGP